MSLTYPHISPVRVHHADLHDANVVQHWGFFRREELASSPAPLRMLDVDLGRACSLACPTCFRRANRVDDCAKGDLRYADLLAVLDDAKGIGLAAVKICGAGEPLESPLLLPFAQDLTERGIGLSVFTKGHVLGDDAQVRRIYARYGIKDAWELARRFHELRVSFLVSFQSPDPQIQEALVGGVMGYSQKRDRALEILANTGFNKCSPTRLAMCANPMLRSNLPHLYDIYVYARERNILPVNAALMVSGKQFNASFLRAHDVSPDDKIRLYQKIYEYNLAHGLSTPDQLAEEGISCMPGIHPCNQIAVGLYVTSNGTVIRCPGDRGNPMGNVRQESIRDIWRRCGEWRFTGRFNCGCPFKDGCTIPKTLYPQVLDGVGGEATVTGCARAQRRVRGMRSPARLGSREGTALSRRM